MTYHPESLPNVLYVANLQAICQTTLAEVAFATSFTRARSLTDHMISANAAHFASPLLNAYYSLA
jgi:hypothetical protein